jgi:hypothetical protein
MEPAAVGAALALALAAARWARRRDGAADRGVGRLVGVVAEAYAAATWERAHRDTLVAAVTVLPPGGLLVDRRADGATLTIQVPALAAAVPGTAGGRPHGSR